jgi:hypothetical protein
VRMSAACHKGVGQSAYALSDSARSGGFSGGQLCEAGLVVLHLARYGAVACSMYRICVSETQK